MIVDLIPAFFGGGPAHFGVGPCPEAFGDTDAKLDDALRLGERQGLRIGIGHDEVHTVQAGFDHVVDGIAASTANTEHGDAGLEFLNVRDGEVDGHEWPHSGVLG